MKLGEFTQKFLKHQGLEDFYIVFEPFKARRPRRAKRSSAEIDAQDPRDGKPLPNTRTAGDLITRMFALAPQMQDWTEGPKSYVPRLYDDLGVLVKPTELLSDLRKRSENRLQEGEQRARKILARAIHACDRALGDPALVTRIAKSVLNERTAG